MLLTARMCVLAYCHYVLADFYHDSADVKGLAMDAPVRMAAPARLEFRM